MELTWALLRLLESVQLVTLSTLRFPVGTLTRRPPIFSPKLRDLRTDLLVIVSPAGGMRAMIFRARPTAWVPGACAPWGVCLLAAIP